MHMGKKLKVVVELELFREDPEGEEASRVLKDTPQEALVLMAGDYEFEVSGFVINGLVD
jgi:hypothetical protein